MTRVKRWLFSRAARSRGVRRHRGRRARARARAAARRTTRRSGRGSPACCSSTSRTCGRPRSSSTSIRPSGGAGPRSTPACRSPCFAAGVALYACGAGVFWRAIAYLAVFHFIRQQYGWVMMYRARNGERDRLGRWLDGATIYLATLYPLVVVARAAAARVRVDEGRRLRRRAAGVGSPTRARHRLRRAARRVRRCARCVAARRSIVGQAPRRRDDRRVLVRRHRRDEQRLRVHRDERVHPRHPVHGARLSSTRAHASRERASRDGARARACSRKRGLLVFLATLWVDRVRRGDAVGPRALARPPLAVRRRLRRRRRRDRRSRRCSRCRSSRTTCSTASCGGARANPRLGRLTLRRDP